jgi:predicted Zn-dependent peptidase
VQHTHKFAEEIAHVKKNEAYKYKPTTENIVYIAPYDANQIYLMSASIGNETFDVKELPAITLYNTYFGGNMSGIVFQEMREARALAYHASAYISEPSRKEEPCIYKTFIATQNDKMIDAITTFDEIINNMPVSQKAFDIAKESLISHLRTERISGGEILSYYLSQQELGLTQDSRRQLYEAVLAMTLEDVVEYQQAKVKGLKYTTCVLGREADLDMKSLEKWGKIIRLTQEELFGY